MPSSSRKYTRPQSRLLAIVTLFAMLMATVPMQVAAKSTDLEGHWGNDVIQRWIDRGLAGGYPDGMFRPDGKVTRAEFMKLINKSFAFVKEQDIGYSDVQESDWFFAEVRKASAAGYITGYEDGTIRPNDAISRQEVAVVFVRLKKFTLDPAVTEMFADQQTIDDWSRGAIGAVVREGLMKGYPDDTFKPKSLLTRAEAIASLDRGLPQAAITTVYDKAGTYGPKAGKETVARDVVIESDGVVLQNLHITGTLTISEKVGKGTVTLNNLTVDKKVIVRGGGKDSVYFNGGTYKEGVVVGNTPGGEVRIVAKADTALPIVVEQTATKQTVILDGKLSTVVADGKDNTIVANPKTEIETLKVNETAQQTIIKNEKDAIIKEMKTDAVVKIENNGVISKAIEGTKATESTAQLTGTKPVEKPIEPPAVVVAPVAPAPVSGGGGSSGSTTPVTNSPPTNITLSSTSIAENAGNNATVGTLTATDVDAGSTFTYALVAGDGSTDNASFNISGATLRANSSLDFETKSSYSVRVQVTDNGGLTYAKSFAITVTNVNEAPTDITLSATAIAENAGNNATIGTLTATDVDAGSTFTYALVAGDGSTDNVSFNISGTTLRANNSLDFETKSSYSIRVKVTDNGTPGLTHEKTFTVTVTNVNENPTAITLSGTTIAENATINSLIGTIGATDSDVANTHTYALVAGDGSTDNAQFSIANSTELRSVVSFDHETQPTRSIRLEVTDNTGLKYVQVFTITVTNVNEAPTDVALSATAIAENAGNDATVGTLSATDVDAGSTFAYALVAGDGSTDNASFSISGNTLRANSSFDYETESSYDIRVQVTDNGNPALTYVKTFAIIVTNVNDNTPTDITLSATTIAENAENNATIGTLTATDADSSTFTYALVAGDGSTDNASFNISGNALRANSSFDFETKSSYSVRVQVTDNGGLTYAKSFAITVANVNENPTDVALSGTTIAENEGNNATVGTLTATDADSSTFTYALVAGDGSTDNASFNISGNALRANNSFDFETKSSYSVRVQVTDNGGLTYAKSFEITVTNVNEAPTNITLSSTSIAENAGNDATVGTLSGTDVDANSTFTYALVAGDGSTDNASFNVNGTTLRANSSFDFETKSSYSVRVQVTDNGGLTYAKSFAITVTNVNENPTDVALSATTIAENAGNNAAVGTLTATDVDAGSTFTYALVAGTGDGDNAPFNISGNELRANSSFDFEMKSSYSIRVQVTDNGGLTYAKTFTITVTNVNENPTAITLSGTTIAENAAINSIIGTIGATDQDAGNTHTYALVAGSGATNNAEFSITNGNELRSAVSFDHETQVTTSIRVEVTDNTGLKYEQVFTITVTNVNEAPTNVTLSATTIAENAGSNATIGTLAGTDVDAGSTFAYALVSGTGDTNNSAFNISGNTLRANSSFDFETKSSYSIRVQVTDNGAPALTYEKTFTITVTNVGEAPTNMTLSSDTIAEGDTGGNVDVGTLTTTDADAGNTFTYTLVSGTGDTNNNLFNISDDDVRTTSTITAGTYNIRIRVTDDTTLTFEKQFTITVTP